MPQLPDLNHLSHAEKDALIRALWAQVQSLTARVAELEARLGEPPKTPDNSSLPPSKGQKPNQPEKAKRVGPRQGSLGRKGGGRPLACDPDETVTAKAAACAHCQAALTEADQVLHGRYDKIDLPLVRPVVTRVERYAGHCPCCGGVTLAPVPEGLEDGSPFSVNILALAIYLRFTHAISYRRLTQLFLHLFALPISEGALDAMFQRAKPCFDNEVAAILARLRRSRIVCSDETIGAHRRPDPLELGVPERSGGDPRRPQQPRRRRGHRGDGRPPAEHLGVRPLRRPAGPCRSLAGLPGAPAARLPIRHRGGRHDLRPAHEGAAAARGRAGPAAQAPGREHAARLSAPAGSRAGRDHGAGSRPTATASGCANVTARCAATCSPSSSIPTRRRTTTAASGNCGPPPRTARSPAASAPTGAPICSPAFDPSSAPPHDAGIDAYQAIRAVLDGESVIQPG